MPIEPMPFRWATDGLLPRRSHRSHRGQPSSLPTVRRTSRRPRVENAPTPSPKCSATSNKSLVAAATAPSEPQPNLLLLLPPPPPLPPPLPCLLMHRRRRRHRRPPMCPLRACRRPGACPKRRHGQAGRRICLIPRRRPREPLSRCHGLPLRPLAVIVRVWWPLGGLWGEKRKRKGWGGVSAILTHPAHIPKPAPTVDRSQGTLIPAARDGVENAGIRGRGNGDGDDLVGGGELMLLCRICEQMIPSSELETHSKVCHPCDC